MRRRHRDEERNQARATTIAARRSGPPFRWTRPRPNREALERASLSHACDLGRRHHLPRAGRRRHGVVGPALSQGEFAAQQNACSIVQVDVARVGGITPWLKTAHLAETFNIAVCPHFLMELHVALTCAVPNARWLELLTTRGIEIRDGYYSPEPGAWGDSLGFRGDRAAELRTEAHCGVAGFRRVTDQRLDIRGERKRCSVIPVSKTLPFVNPVCKLAKLAVDLHKHLIQMPVQLEEAAQMRNSLLSDLCREQRPTRFHQNRMVSWLMSTHARPRDIRPFAATVGAARTSLRQTNQTSGEPLKYRNGLRMAHALPRSEAARGIAVTPPWKDLKFRR